MTDTQAPEPPQTLTRYYPPEVNRNTAVYLASEVEVVKEALEENQLEVFRLSAEALALQAKLWQAQATVATLTRENQELRAEIQERERYRDRQRDALLAELEARQAAGAGGGDHSTCHDLVCNCDTVKYPRGAYGVGCSCRGRDERAGQGGGVSPRARLETPHE